MQAQRDDRARALAWLEEYVAGIDEAALTGVSQGMFDDVIAEIPELAGSTDAQADLIVGIRETVRSFLSGLPRDPWPVPEVPAAGIEYTRVFVRLGFPISVLLKLYRLGSASLWRRMMAVAEAEIADAAVRREVLGLMWDRLVPWVEVYVERQTDLYDEERDRWLRGALARRVETVGAILSGEERDADRAGRVLAFELQRHHTALIAWVDPDAPAGGAEVEAVIAEVAAALGGHRALTVASGSRAVWAWVGTADAPETRGLALPEAEGPRAAVRVAVGQPGFGIAGFRDSHREAREAQRVATIAPRPERLVRYEDVEIVALLSTDETVMRRLVHRELGALAATDAVTTRLRRTTYAFLACGLSARAAAEELGTHKNTVLYRLRRVEDLLGHAVSERRLQLQLALMLVDVLGERALGP